jgi:hypothetical protein
VEAHVPLVQAFNDRLRKGGSEFRFLAHPTNQNSLTGASNQIHSEHFVVLDQSGAVRGAYTLLLQRFFIGGVSEEVAFLQIPISEGSVNPAYGIVGLMLLKDALRRSPLLFGLGMGGIDRPLPKLFRVLGALVREVPFMFRVVHPRAFLRNATAFRNRPLLRAASQIGTNTGLGTIAFGLIHAFRSLHAVTKRSLRIENVPSFQQPADDVWKSAAQHYSCLSFRDSETLNYLYPQKDTRYHRLIIHQDGKLAGWSVVTDSQMKNHNHFGDMRVGAIANCLAREGHEDAVIAGANYYLRDRGVDLIVSNQAHGAWVKALNRAGYLKYRSNFVLALSRLLTEKIKVHDPLLERVHMNRGDGDGAYNL